MNIFRALLVAAVLLIGWSVVIRQLPEDLETAQTLWGGNLIYAQDYLYEDVLPEDVAIVGSSLSENLLLREVAGRRVHRLGLAGQGVFDGLHLVAAAPRRPGTVFIEMNVVLTGENARFSAAVHDPAMNTIRYHLPVLRQRNQPVGVIKGWLTAQSGKDETSPGDLQDRPINNMSLKIKQRDYASSVASDTLLMVLGELRRRVETLRAEGVRIVFFETPVDPSLCRAPKALAIRKGFEETFPPGEYAYIRQPPCADYLTTDGHHLGKRSLARYSGWLGEQMEELLKESEFNQ